VTAPAITSGYAAVRDALAEQRCVILDGGVATELPDETLTGGPQSERLWGIRALASSPGQVKAVHRRYVDVGCDVVTTNTWGLASAVAAGDQRPWDDGGAQPVHWLEVARRGVRVARQAIAEGGRDGRVAVAFSLNADLDADDGRETIRLLTRAFRDEPPDLVLLETLSLVPGSLYDTVGRLLDTGLPVWLSFRRCRHGVCGVYGQHWGGPEGDAFGRAARRFEEMGVDALLVNCVPPDHVDGMVSYLRDFTDMPLGVYPNLGYLTSAGWQFADGVGGEEYAAMALRWREEGAQIVGGCCGVTPGHIAAARSRLAGTAPGRRRAEPGAVAGAPAGGRERLAEPWIDRRGRPLFPLRFPELVADRSGADPNQSSFLMWRHLYQQEVGAERRCLDVGCGTGLQAIQLALNGAAHVHAIDVDPLAVEDTLTNAFRNGVDARVTAATVDLYPWVPDERYDTIVACLDQTPVDPFRHASSHRPVDYWGRNLVDHLIRLLPEALTDDGEAYVTLLSILSQERTVDMLAQHGLRGEVVDFAVVPFGEPFRESQDQIERVEGLSDAYHLKIGTSDVMVAYLVRMTRR